MRKCMFCGKNVESCECTYNDDEEVEENPQSEWKQEVENDDRAN